MNTLLMEKKTRLTKLKDALFLKKADVYHKVSIMDIAFVKSSDNYCETTTIGGESFMSRIQLGKYQELLPTDHFLRIHRQYIVQTGLIEKINFKEHTISIQKFTIPFSRKRLEDFIQLINKLE